MPNKTRFDAHEIAPVRYAFPPLQQKTPTATELSSDYPAAGILTPIVTAKELPATDNIDKENSQPGLPTEAEEEGYQAGVRLGYAAGVKKGRAEGRVVGEALFTDACVPLLQLMSTLKNYLANYESRRRVELLQLVKQVTKQVIHGELLTQPTQLLALIDEALAALPQVPQKIQVLLSSEAFNAIRVAAPEKLQALCISCDPTLPFGECRVLTDSVEIDVGCQHRLDQCVAALEKNLLLDEAHE